MPSYKATIGKIPVPYLAEDSVTYNTVSLSWTLSRNYPKIVNWELQRDSVLLTSPAKNDSSYLDTTVSESTNYTYRIRFIDRSNRYSEWSNDIVASVPAFQDTTPPTITNFYVSDVGTDYVTLNWTSQDNIAVTSYVLTRSPDQATWQSVALSGGGLSGTHTDTGRSEGTTYYYRLRALDAAGNQSGYAYTNATTGTTPQPTSEVLLGDIVVVQNQSNGPWPLIPQSGYGTPYQMDLTPPYQDLPDGFSIDNVNELLVYNELGTTGTGTTTHRIVATAQQSSAEADWLLRTQTGPNAAGVVWYHGFENDDEVNNFRFVAGYVGDPGDVYSTTIAPGAYCRRITSDASFPNGCLEQFVSAGMYNACQWWRPLAPFTGAINGRGQDDPGGGIAVKSDYQVGSGQYQFQGKYLWTHADNAIPTTIATQGFYIQLRVKFAPNRFTADVGTGDKWMYIDCLGDEYGENQELIFQPLGVNGGGWGDTVPGYFTFYSNFGRLDGEMVEPQAWQIVDFAGGVTSYMPGNTAGFSGGTYPPGPQPGDIWQMPTDEWITFLFYIEPGDDTAGGDADAATAQQILAAQADANFNKTKIIIWAAASNLPGGKTTYSKIWDKQDYVLNYDDNYVGYNALKIAQFVNAGNPSFGADTYHRFAQVILSKSFIPCPQDGL